MNRRGFTLIELLVVITIILILFVVGAVAYRMSGNQTDAAARLLQAALVGARDEAIKTGQPAGIRLLPDPAFPQRYLANGQIDPSQPLAANRIIPIAAAPNYTEGELTKWTGPLPAAVATLPYGGPGTPANPNPTWGNTSALMVFESILNNQGALNSPTSWWWNIRIGDKLQIGGAGRWFTVVGPMLTPNPELYVNVGPAGTQSPLQQTLANGATAYPEFLLLVNGVDDNRDGYIDSGWDGVDNDNQNGIDDIGEWVETEVW